MAAAAAAGRKALAQQPAIFPGIAAREQHMQQHIRREAARVEGCRRRLMVVLTAFFICQDLAPFQLVGVAGVSSSLSLRASV